MHRRAPFLVCTEDALESALQGAFNANRELYGILLLQSDYVKTIIILSSFIWSVEILD